MSRRLFLMLFVVLLSFGGCTGEDEGGIQVERVWGRPSPQAARNGAFYLSIANGGNSEDTLVEVRAARCDTVELHETSLDESDVMRMRPVAGGRIPVAAGQTVTLGPGGLHVMCVGLKAPLVVGEEVPLTLVFANAGEMAVTAEIREEEP